MIDHDDRFPLYLHKSTGQWMKKIRGKQYYFGKDRDAALQKWLSQKADLLIDARCLEEQRYQQSNRYIEDQYHHLLRLAQNWRGGWLVYFILMRTDDRYIKIGKTKHLPKRLYSLRTSSPYDLEVLLTIAGEVDGADIEKLVHTVFRHSRIRQDGEWFAADAMLFGFITEAKRKLRDGK